VRVLIAGGAGFVGANLAVSLSRHGHDVTSADNLRRRGSERNLVRLSEAGVRFEHADTRCPEDWAFLSEFDPETILVCAAQPSAIDGYRNPMFDFQNNTVAVLHLLEHCRRSGAQVVFWSSNKAYPVWAVDAQNGPLERRPTRLHTDVRIDETCPLDGGDRSLYGASKVASDLIIQEWAESFGFPAVVNRCSCLAGPWQWGKVEQGWVAWWVIAHRLGLPLEYIGFEGLQVRDVLHIDDLADLVSLQILDPEAGAQVFNVGGGGYSLSLRECTELCQGVTGMSTRVTESGTPRRADFAHYVSDTSKVKARYGWEPSRSPETVIIDIDAWFTSNLEALK